MTVDGVEVLPAGSVVRGNVASVESAGKVKGRASLGLLFSSLTAYNERHPISARWAAQAESTKKQDATKIGIGAGAGAIIGGIIGGGKGAATGAVVGGGAGTAMVLTSEGKPIALGDGAEITVKLANPIDVKVPVQVGRPPARLLSDLLEPSRCASQPGQSGQSTAWMRSRTREIQSFHRRAVLRPAE